MESVITVTGWPYISTGKNKAEYNRDATGVSYHLDHQRDYYWTVNVIWNIIRIIIGVKLNSQNLIGQKSTYGTKNIAAFFV